MLCLYAIRILEAFRIERNEIVFGGYISCIMRTVKEKAANYSLPLVILYHLFDYQYA